MSNESSMSTDLAELLTQADQAFVNSCQARHEKGEEKYGPMTFLEVDTLEMAMEEVVDLANYARYTFIKLYMLQRAAKRSAERHPATDSQGFISLKEMFQP